MENKISANEFQIGETRVYGEATVERRSRDFMAYITGDKTRWEAGTSVDDALLKLQTSYPKIDILGADPEARLIDVSDIFELVKNCGDDLGKIKTTYDSLLGRKRQESFLVFFSDEQIIQSGIFENIADLSKAFPNLRY